MQRLEIERRRWSRAALTVVTNRMGRKKDELGTNGRRRDQKRDQR